MSWAPCLQDHVCGDIYDILGCEPPAHLAREMLPHKHRSTKEMYGLGSPQPHKAPVMSEVLCAGGGHLSKSICERLHPQLLHLQMK